MKKSIKGFLNKVLKLEVSRVSMNPKEAPIDLINIHGQRFVYFYELARKIDDIQGNIVECGVGWGRSLYAFSLFESILNKGRHIYGFDSFEGFPEPSKEDEPERYGIKKGRYSTNQESVIKHLTNSGISKDFIEKKVTLVKGFFESTLNQYDNGSIALLHLDVDLYQSYKDCLEYLYPLVAKGGIIAFDEYHKTQKYSGCKKAVNEFFKGKEKIIKSNIIDRYYLIKEAE